MRIRAKHVIKDMTLDLEHWFEQHYDTGELSEEIERGEDLSQLAQAYSDIQDAFSQVESDAVPVEGDETLATFQTDHITVVEAGEYIFEIDTLEGDSQKRLEETGEFKSGLWEPNEDYEPPVDKPNPKNQRREVPNGAPHWMVHLTPEGQERMNHHSHFYAWNPKDRSKHIYPGVTTDGDLVFSDEVGGEPLSYVQMTGRTDLNFDALTSEWWSKADPQVSPGRDYEGGASTVTQQGVRVSPEDEEIH